MSRRAFTKLRPGRVGSAATDAAPRFDQVREKTFVIVIGAAVFGIVLGGYTARKRGGRWPDIAQYATAFGIAFCLAGILATITLERIFLG